MRYEKYERVQRIMAYIHSKPTQRHTLDSISNGVGIPQGSIRKSIYYDYPECFDRRAQDRGIVLSGEYPDDMPLPLDNMVKEWFPRVKVESTIRPDRQFQAKYFDKGYEGVAAMLSDEAKEVLREVIRSPEKITFTSDITQLYNTVKAVEIIIRACRSDDRKDGFDRLIDSSKESSTKVEKLIDRRT